MSTLMIIGHMSPVHLKQHMGFSAGSKREQTLEKQKKKINKAKDGKS